MYQIHKAEDNYTITGASWHHTCTNEMMYMPATVLLSRHLVSTNTKIMEKFMEEDNNDSEIIEWSCISQSVSQSVSHMLASSSLAQSCFIHLTNEVRTRHLRVSSNRRQTETARTWNHDENAWEPKTRSSPWCTYEWAPDDDSTYTVRRFKSHVYLLTAEVIL